MPGQVPEAGRNGTRRIVDRQRGAVLLRAEPLRLGPRRFVPCSTLRIGRGALRLCRLSTGPGIAAPTATSQAAIVADSLPPLFDTESAAQAHCPKDVVVWLNIPSGIYHYKGERWYGRTEHGSLRLPEGSHCSRRSRQRERAVNAHENI